jgi:hypothetical protein
MGDTALEQEVAALRMRLDEVAERVRLDAVAEAFLRGDHSVRAGDCFLLHGDKPTRLYSVSSEGKWTYDDGRNCVEPFRIPEPTEYPRLYTIAEVAEILAKAKATDLTAEEAEALRELRGLVIGDNPSDVTPRMRRALAALDRLLGGRR